MEFNLSAILQKEREIFDHQIENSYYEKYAKSINKICKLIKKDSVKKKVYLKRWEDDIAWFDKKRKNYKLEKADNLKFKRFPEPTYFTTKAEYYEYQSINSLLQVLSNNDIYTTLLALAIRQSELDHIYDLLETQKNSHHADFDECMYYLTSDFSYLFSPETRIVLYNWGRKVPRNHYKIFEKIEQWQNGSMLSMYAFEEEDRKQFDYLFESKEMIDFFDWMALTPTNDNNTKQIELYSKEAPSIIEPTEMDNEKVSFKIELKDVFITEEQNWGSRTKYTKKQLEHLKNLTNIVQDYLINNNIILQSKEDDPPYFWSNKRYREKEIRQRKKNRMFPELDYFISGDNIYYYFDNYFFNFEAKDSPNYQLFFAFRLRQIRLEDVEDFLNEKRREFEGDFVAFFNLIIINYKNLFSEETLQMAKKWKNNWGRDYIWHTDPNLLKEMSSLLNPWIMRDLSSQKEVPAKKINNTKITAKEPLEKKSFLNIPFSKPPSNYSVIEGKLNETQIKNFLSFLYLEDNDSQDGFSFLSEQEVIEVFKYGLAYPKQEPSKKYYSLKLNSKKTKILIGYLFGFLYRNHKPSFYPPKDFKDQFAKLLKYNFDNFTEDLSSIRNSFRDDRKPKRLNEKKFKISKYVDFENTN